MVAVDDNRLKGNYAAALVSARLSSACLVRPVAADTDVGVDLYCEIVASGKPFLHFWVQVKSGAQCAVLDGGRAATCRFRTDHLLYWREQPVPVFAALVPVDWPVKTEPPVYVVDVTQFLISGAFKPEQASQVLRSGDKWSPGNSDDIPYFLQHTVPLSTALLQCHNGVLTTVRQPTPQYFKAMPPAPVERFGFEVLKQLRTTAAAGIVSMKRRGVLGDLAHTDLRRQLAAVLDQFESDRHWETHAARGYSHHLDDDFELAAECYHKSIAVIDDDTATKGDRGFELLREELQALAEDAAARLAFHPKYGPV